MSRAPRRPSPLAGAPTAGGRPAARSRGSDLAACADDAVDRILRVLARRACQVAGVHTCSVYLREPNDGTFRGRAIHNPVRPDALEWLRHSQAGIHADGFTRQIVETKAPVLITNARRDPRPVQTAMREWEIDEMLGVPMVIEDEVVGLLFLDNRGEPHEYSTREQLALLALANVGALAVRNAERAVRDARALRGLVRENRALRQASAVQNELTQRVLNGGGIDDLARAVAAMTGKPCAILDDELEQLAAAMAPGGAAAWALGMHGMRSQHCVGAVSDLAPGEHTTIEPSASAGIHRRLLMVRGPDHARGCLVALAEHGSPLSTFDLLVAEHAAALVALLHAAQGALRWDGAGAPERAGTSDAAATDPDRLAHQCGLDETELCAVALVSCDPGAALEVSALEVALVDAGIAGPAVCAPHERGVFALFPLGAGAELVEAKRALHAALAALGPRHGPVAVALRTRGEGFRAALRECEALLDAEAGGHGAASDAIVDRGGVPAASHFLAYCDAEAAERLARGLLAGLLDDGRDARRMLATLRRFIAEGRSVRRVADALGVHENTVRYRLRRVAEVTGLDVMHDPDDQLAAQLALLAVKRAAGRRPARGRADSGRDRRGVLPARVQEPMPTA